MQTSPKKRAFLANARQRLAMVAVLLAQGVAALRERPPIDEASATTGGLGFGGGFDDLEPGVEVGIAGERQQHYPSLDEYDCDLLEVALNLSRSDPEEFKRLANRLGYEFIPILTPEQPSVQHP